MGGLSRISIFISLSFHRIGGIPCGCGCVMNVQAAGGFSRLPRRRAASHTGGGVLSQSLHNWVTKIVGWRSGRTNPPPTPSVGSARRRPKSPLIKRTIPRGGGGGSFTGWASLRLFVYFCSYGERPCVRPPPSSVCLRVFNGAEEDDSRCVWR